MININRVSQMTKMAMYAKDESRSYNSVINYEKKDYILMRMLRGFFAGSIFFVVVYGGFVAVLFSLFLRNITWIILLSLVLGGIAGYILYIYIHLGRVRKKAESQYQEGMEHFLKYKQELEVLNRMYETEEDA